MNNKKEDKGEKEEVQIQGNKVFHNGTMVREYKKTFNNPQDRKEKLREEFRQYRHDYLNFGSGDDIEDSLVAIEDYLINKLEEELQKERDRVNQLAQNAYSVLSFLYFRNYINYEKKGCPTKEEIDEKLKFFSKALNTNK